MVAPLEVDVTGWLQNRLSELLTPVRVLTETPGNLAAEIAAKGGVVQLVRVGGLDDGVIVDQPRIVAHAFGADAASARALSHRIGTAYRQLVGAASEGATLQSVSTVSGPSPNSYPNTSVREVVRTDELRIKATR